MSRVVLTQPEPRVEALAQFVRSRGHEVLCLPAGRLETRACALWSDWVHGVGALPPDWVIFVSPGALEAARAVGWPEVWPAQTGLAVIGPGTRQALLACPGIGPQHAIVQPARPPFDADALMREPPFAQPLGLRVQVVQGEGVRSSWVDALAARGARVERVEVYCHRSYGADTPLPGATLQGWAREPLSVHFVMTSRSGVQTTAARLAAAGLLPWAQTQIALAQHPRILEACRLAGWVSPRGIEPGREALLAALESV